MEMYKNMRKLILFLVVISMVGCKTKTILVENVRNVKDSTENVQLKAKIKQSENLLLKSEQKLQQSEKKIYSLIEQLNVSESEKQNLKESFETIIKEYNEKGILIKETYSKKTSELVKELSWSEQKNKFLQEENDKNTLLLQAVSANYNKEVENNIDLDKKVTLLEKENRDLKEKKATSTGFQWWWLVIGFAGGIVIYHYVSRLVKVIF